MIVDWKTVPHPSVVCAWEDLLLNAVLDNPEDMSVRLVYADWLEERGDPLAEFIRVQIALSEVDLQAEANTPIRANERTAPTAERINLARRNRLFKNFAPEEW